MTPAELVQRQVEAYNDRNLDRFVACYSDSVTVVRLPATQPTISGKTQLTDFYATQRFSLAGLRADIVNRMIMGNKVVDHERIWGVRDEPFEAVAVYEVTDDLIQRVWFFSP